MPMYTKRLQLKIEDWMEEYLDTMGELCEMTEPELVRMLLALGMGSLEAHLLGIGSKEFFEEIGIPKFKNNEKMICDIEDSEKHRVISRIYFIARQMIERRMKTLRK